MTALRRIGLFLVLCSASAASAAEVTLIQKKHDPYGAPRPAPEQKKKAAEAEKAYHSALDKIPDKKFDPWGNVR